MADVELTVASPAFGEIFYTPYLQSMLRLQRTVCQRNWMMRHASVSHTYVAEARNYLLTPGSTKVTPRTFYSSTRIWVSTPSSSST